uniref:L-2-hydroxyglutarate dehydrogenase, mitochondrial n=1 Tax=Cyprinus carpio TaxID=7962 RepID=A0A8C2KTH6_CYPCA
MFLKCNKNGSTYELDLDNAEVAPYIMELDSPNTGIVDWQSEAGGTVLTLNSLFSLISLYSSLYVCLGLKYPIGKEVKFRFVLTCEGLYSDLLSEISGCSSEPRIVPFRGGYLVLKLEKNYLVSNIYSDSVCMLFVPNPRFPFHGFHFTPRMDGSVWLGPNGRDILFDFDTQDFINGRLVMKNIVYGMGEIYRGVFTSAQVKHLQKFIPELNPTDVLRGPSGLCAQTLDSEGNLVDDFVLDGEKGELGSRILHVRNALSPTAGSSLAITEMIADELEKRFQL